MKYTTRFSYGVKCWYRECAREEIESPTNASISLEYKGDDGLVAGIVLAAITFWLFAQTTLNALPSMRTDLQIDDDLSDSRRIGRPVRPREDDLLCAVIDDLLCAVIRGLVYEILLHIQASRRNYHIG